MIIFLIIIGLFILIFNLPITKGYLGEKRIAYLLKKNNNEIINNFYYKENGKSTQIDHIVINKNGVFVIETKNYSGRIYGNDEQLYWTQVLNFGKTKNKLYNPIKQNNSHIYVVNKLLNSKFTIYNCVAFVKGNIDYIDSKNVYSPKGLKRFISSSKSTYLSLDDIVYIKKTLISNSSRYNKREHIRNINSTLNKLNENICPRCGGKLILKSSNNGKLFYGCINYPKCSFSKGIN